MSNYVELEAALPLNPSIGPRNARECLKFIGESGIAEIVVDQDVNEESRRLSEADEALSLTDAATVVLMGTVGAKQVATTTPEASGNTPEA